MNTTKYSFKDAYKLLRTISIKAKELADSKEQMIIAQLEKSTEHQDRTKFGLLSIKTYAEKTIKVYTEEEQAEVDRLQAEINKLKAEMNLLGTTKVVKGSHKSLAYYKTTEAETEAQELLQDLINSLGNASFIKAANKTPEKTK